MVIAYFLQLDDYMTETASEPRYDVVRQYVTEDGVVDDDVEYENCTVEQGRARLRELSRKNPAAP